MPHIVIEYFCDEGLDRQAVLNRALETAVASGAMNRADIKVRLLPSEAILMGDGRGSFLHVTISLLAGRSDAVKLALAEAMTSALRGLCPQIGAISTDIRDMNPACYKKSLLD
ncbi:5-carboxymethyl-2-hydroxymuconate Delta-isomerase [Oceanicola sp. S124]|uniref:5-carboxymethyl-2-hydroxymuconate Delta-isomerase n=1 Tax=Oceanicola sp. S124 TaxID=1042378 RepID=UPI0002559052|nr:5-carboxymethyl-2-hydroxymuconate isomerase [Oceanicola sp. S124]